MVDDEYLNISFSIDLIELAIQHLDFLKRIDLLEHLYDGEYLKRALFRYLIIKDIIIL
jgi:hypothetical protein